ncbi:hypothetical protein NMG60_11003917 [Bertholletia excelsa]
MFNSAFTKSPVIENPGNCSKELKPIRKIKEANRHAGRNRNNPEDTPVREKRYISSGACNDSKKLRHQDNLLLRRGDIETIKSTRVEHGILLKGDSKSVVAASNKSRTSNDMDPGVTRKCGEQCGSKRTEADENEPKESLEFSRRQMKREETIPSSKDKASNDDEGMTKVDTSKDAVNKKRQQRDAVDALLCSALISSKKTKTLKSPPAIRPVSIKATAGCGIKPPKVRKVTSSSTVLEDQSSKPR